jgi:hypothetical protein
MLYPAAAAFKKDKKRAITVLKWKRRSNEGVVVPNRFGVRVCYLSQDRPAATLLEEE